jgi:NTE family protein
MKRALVLGGGAVIGIAWESGLMNGLRDGGVDIHGFDAIVGTSAGAMVGAQVASGRVPQHPDAQREARALERQQGTGAQRPSDPPKPDVISIAKIFKLWAQMQESSAEQLAAIGKVVRELDRSAEPQWIAQIDDAVRVAEWPALPLLINAVDIDSGVRRVFTRDDGVPLARAMSASAAVPGVYPAVEIGGRLYMDGQTQSCTNADVLLPHRPAQVLIAMPTNNVTARGIGTHAERMAEREIEALRAAGCEVHFTTPSAEDGQRLGGNLMDGSKATEAFAVGVETGLRWAKELG